MLIIILVANKSIYCSEALVGVYCITLAVFDKLFVYLSMQLNIYMNSKFMPQVNYYIQEQIWAL